MSNTIADYIASLAYTVDDPPPTALQPTPALREFKPLDVQLQEFVRALPAAMLTRPWQISDLLMRLEGKYRAHPSPQKLSEQMRKAGWTRQRCWSQGYDGVRLWYPPKE